MMYGTALAPTYDREDAREDSREDAEAIALALAFFRPFQDQSRRVDSLISLRDRLMAAATGASPLPLGEVRSAGFSDARGLLYARLADLDRETDQAIDLLVAMRADVLRALVLLENPHASSLLEYIFLDGLPHPEAAQKAGFSCRYAYRIKKEALQDLGRLLRARPDLMPAVPAPGSVSP